LKTLILGGTDFLGRHLVESALKVGHRVTVFNRGRTNPGLWPQVEELRGDRDGDLGALEGRSWDCVVDTSGFVPRIVRESAELLANSVPHYTFVSTISVYADFGSGPNETSPVAQLPEPGSEDVQRDYGPLKAASERVIQELLPKALLSSVPVSLSDPGTQRTASRTGPGGLHEAVTCSLRSRATCPCSSSMHETWRNG
jgi:2'-hydroxyisoflavone reductase